MDFPWRKKESALCSSLRLSIRIRAQWLRFGYLEDQNVSTNPSHAPLPIPGVSAPFRRRRAVKVQKLIPVILRQELKSRFGGRPAFSMRQTFDAITNLRYGYRAQNTSSPLRLKPGYAFDIRVWFRRLRHDICVEKIRHARGSQRCLRSGISKPLSRRR